MVNFLSETLSVLRREEIPVDDVAYVFLDDGIRCFWEDFAKAANEIYYDNGFGRVEINPSLMIVGFDWWLERREYDGSEWWEYCEAPHCDNGKIITDTKLLCGYLRPREEEE